MLNIVTCQDKEREREDIQSGQEEFMARSLVYHYTLMVVAFRANMQHSVHVSAVGKEVTQSNRKADYIPHSLIHHSLYNIHQ